MRVTLLEADIVGGGPSGRNGGFLTGWWDYLPALVGNFGRDAGLAAARALDGAPAWIGEWAVAHGVDPWFVPGGTLIVSTSPVQDDAWAGILELARELGVEDRYVPHGQEVRPLRLPAAPSGLLVPSDAQVQPARLARGLRRVLWTRRPSTRDAGDGPARGRGRACDHGHRRRVTASRAVLAVTRGGRLAPRLRPG
jgi:glycine/D-amino acid oxidase-like deaminating enzyme